MKRQVLNAAIALGLVLAAPSHANLVVNGGFELGNVPVTNDNRTNYIEGWMTQGDVFTKVLRGRPRHSCRGWIARKPQASIVVDI